MLKTIKTNWDGLSAFAQLNAKFLLIAIILAIIGLSTK